MAHSRYRVISLLMTGLTLVGLFSACAGPAPVPAATKPAGSQITAAPAQATTAPAGNVTLRMWVHSNPHYQKMAEQFAAEYEKETGVKIQFDFIPWEEYGSKAVAAFAGNSEPDIMEGVASWLYAQKVAGRLDPVPDDLAQSMTDTYHAAGLPPLEYKGKYYGIPLNVNIDAGPLFIYNKAVFDEAGIKPEWDSWDAYIKDLQTLTTVQNGVMTRSGLTVAGGDLMVQFCMYFLQAGGTFYSADGKSVTINNEYGRKALQVMYDFIHTYKVDTTDVTDFAIAKGSSGGTFYGPWYTKVLDEEFPDVKWGWAKPPLMPGATTPYFPSTNVWAWMVSSNSPNKQAAWDYVRWLNQNEHRLAWSEETGEIPAVKALWQDPTVANNPRFAPWLPLLQYQVPLAHIGPQDEYTKALEDMVNSVLFKQATIDEALAKAEKTLNDMIARTQG